MRSSGGVDYGCQRGGRAFAVSFISELLRLLAYEVRANGFGPSSAAISSLWRKRGSTRRCRQTAGTIAQDRVSLISLSTQFKLRHLKNDMVYQK